MNSCVLPLRSFSWKRFQSVWRGSNWIEILANCLRHQSITALSPGPRLVVSRYSTSGWPVFASRPSGYPASASSFFAASSGRRCALPSFHSCVTGLMLPAPSR